MDAKQMQAHMMEVFAPGFAKIGVEQPETFDEMLDLFRRSGMSLQQIERAVFGDTDPGQLASFILKVKREDPDGAAAFIRDWDLGGGA